MKNTIAVHGRGELSIVPDHASIRVGVNTTADTAEAALKENAAAAERIRQALVRSGIQEKDIQTVNYDVYPQYNREQRIESYAANYDLAVDTDDIARLSLVLDTCVRSGANRINSIEFSLKDEKKHKQDALVLAIKDAREKAEIIAQSLGRRLGKAVYAAEDRVTYENIYARNLKQMATTEDAAGAPILAGNISIRTSMDVVFELL